MNAVTTTSALQCTGLDAGYGSVTVTRGIDLAVAPGSVLAVLGPNGAGKTTLMLTLAGLLPRLAGDVRVHGTALRDARPAAANKAGVILVPDSRALFTTLTVRENLKVARRSDSMSVDDAMDLFPALRKRLDVTAGALSGGEQQMLAVARGLVQRPRVLLIDEMSMGLAPVIVEELVPVVRRIADESGAAVVIVEQHVGLAIELADEAVVLVHGEVTLRGRSTELAGDRGRLESAYLGAVPAN
ncbi:MULTISPECIES: ABC transporter ATP-binding protein [Nocardia]|uniref:ABC transporter ATP-binding protein n=1 Tax=Nocardia TaxID=1817 RepID=UPI000D69419D|nr:MULTISPECIES: ABC transporter ATP-binding protein [Nocardia]